MDLRYLSRNAASAERMRKLIERRGCTGTGKIWTESEVAAVRQLYPDYRALVAALPNRTLEAIRCKAKKLDIVTNRHIWTAAEHSKLRMMYPGASQQSILASLPGLSWRQITDHAQRSRFGRKKPPYRLTGWPLLDEVRLRCRDLDFTMADLDQMAGTKAYFRHQYWRKSRRRASLAVSKAVVALDGTLRAQWN